MQTANVENVCRAETAAEIQRGENGRHRAHESYGKQDCDIQARLSTFGLNMRITSPIVKATTVGKGPKRKG